jgi:hypothetical protein
MPPRVEPGDIEPLSERKFPTAAGPVKCGFAHRVGRNA